MISRIQISKLDAMLGKYPIVAIIGPRQSGKTTLSKILRPDYQYVNLEDIENRQFAINDPKGFLENYKGGVILDEIQNIPHLFSYLQVVTDQRNSVGEYIITGSHNYLLMQQINQSLAGRVFISTLLPLSLKELTNSNRSFFSWEQYAFSGSYPRKLLFDIPSQDFYENYLITYIERDVRQLKNILNLNLFTQFIKLLAGRVGQIFNQTHFGNELNLDNKTIHAWLTVLETSFIAFRLQPYYKNYNKRIIKTPKVYFYDTGLLCYLLGIRNIEQLNQHFAKGAIFENLIISELYKNNLNSFKYIDFYFWRDSSQNEKDLIFDYNGVLNTVEIKASKTLNDRLFSNINFFDSIEKNLKSYLIYGGNENQKRSNFEIFGWESVSDLF